MNECRCSIIDLFSFSLSLACACDLFTLKSSIENGQKKRILSYITEQTTTTTIKKKSDCIRQTENERKGLVDIPLMVNYIVAIKLTVVRR